MKYKRSLIAGAVLVSLVTIGIVSANNQAAPTPVKIETVKTATDSAPTASDASVPDSNSVTVQATVPDSVVPVTPPTANNQNKLHGIVTAQIAHIIPLLVRQDIPADQLQDLLDTQWFCIDKIITNTVGYDNYDDAYNSPAIQIFVNAPNTDGTYSYFDGRGSCRIYTRLPN